MKIKFGTDGWRAIVAQEFTVDNVARVTAGLAQYLQQQKEKNTVLIGYDCRFGGPLFAETVAKVLALEGISVKLAEGFVTTPMISFGTLANNCDMGVIITASHNPPEYNGYKLKGHYGGPLLPAEVKAVENLIPDTHAYPLKETSLDALKADGLLSNIDLESAYLEKVRENFDLEKIQRSGLKLAYDAMFGSGQRVVPMLLPEVVTFRCDHNPGFEGISPEPIMRNLGAFSTFLKERNDIDSALVTDGDADRIGLMDGAGNFIDSHHIMLLLIHYLHHYKGWTGKVVTGFSSTVKIAQLCAEYGLELEVVPIGFKHVCERMIREDVLMGGEESGGIAVKGFIPERDGIWNGLVIWEAIATTGKSVGELIEEVYALVGSFAFERIDLRISEEEKQRIIANCQSGAYTEFGGRKVERADDMDGFKYYFNDSEWTMIRPSGTEPVLRTYAESANQEKALEILRLTHETILNK